MWKNTVEPGSPLDNIVHAHCMLDTEVYSSHTQNKYTYSTATVVARTPRYASLCVHCVSCNFYLPFMQSASC